MEDLVQLGSPVSEIRFPEMRHEVVEAVRALSDPVYQREAWVDRRLPPGGYDEFTHRIHVLYDDTEVLEDPGRAVGITLRSEREAGSMRKLATILDSMFDRVGTELPDEAYLELPEWSLVIKVARDALNILTEP
jgi:hypothetical protein